MKNDPQNHKSHSADLSRPRYNDPTKKKKKKKRILSFPEKNILSQGEPGEGASPTFLTFDLTTLVSPLENLK